MLDAITLVLVGLGAGFIGSIVGLGGGLIVVPVLTHLGVSPATASANSLFATLGNAAASTLVYSRQRRVRYGSFVRLAVAAIPGTLVGAFASAHVDSEIFKILFAILLVACIAYMVLGRRIKESNQHAGFTAAVLGTTAGFGAGIMSSFFGIGGGVIFVPVLVMVLGYTMRDSTATSQAILVPVSLAALLSHSALGHPEYLDALFLMIGGIVGGLCGAQVSVKISEAYLKISASTVMGLAAIRLALDSLEL